MEAKKQKLIPEKKILSMLPFLLIRDIQSESASKSFQMMLALNNSENLNGIGRLFDTRANFWKQGRDFKK